MCFLELDECVNGGHNCGANASCTDLPNSSENGFSCECSVGYVGDGFTCGDVDECSEGSDTCDADTSTCINTDGGFHCVLAECDRNSGCIGNTIESILISIFSK